MTSENKMERVNLWLKKVEPPITRRRIGRRSFLTWRSLIFSRSVLIVSQSLMNFGITRIHKKGVPAEDIF